MFIRIDDRLIHGQIVTAWLSKLEASNIIVVDDKVSQNIFLQKALKMAVPNKINLEIKSCDDFIKSMTTIVFKKTLILCKTPLTLKTIFENLNYAEQINLNLGNISKVEGREKEFNTIYLTKEEKQILNTFKEKNINIFYQMVPNEPIKTF